GVETPLGEGDEGCDALRGRRTVELDPERHVVDREGPGPGATFGESRVRNIPGVLTRGRRGLGRFRFRCCGRLARARGEIGQLREGGTNRHDDDGENGDPIVALSATDPVRVHRLTGFIPLESLTVRPCRTVFDLAGCHVDPPWVPV